MASVEDNICDQVMEMEDGGTITSSLRSEGEASEQSVTLSQGQDEEKFVFTQVISNGVNVEAENVEFNIGEDAGVAKNEIVEEPINATETAKVEPEIKDNDVDKVQQVEFDDIIPSSQEIKEGTFIIEMTAPDQPTEEQATETETVSPAVDNKNVPIPIENHAPAEISNQEQPAAKPEPKKEEKESNDENQSADLGPCSCGGTCAHRLLKSVLTYLQLAKSQIDESQYENLSNLSQALEQIMLLAKNEKCTMSILKEGIFKDIPPQPTKKGRARKEKPPVETMNEEDFRKLEGLAVFAKWPNSSWYYPGILKGVKSEAELEPNACITFYDGLVRQMKNAASIIFPAHKIPTSCIVYDLEDETELTVEAINIIASNDVEFIVKPKDAEQMVEASFFKLAIKQAQMKSVKLQFEVAAGIERPEVPRSRRGNNSAEVAEPSVSSPSLRKGTRKRTRKYLQEIIDETKAGTAAEPGTAGPAPAAAATSSNTPAKRKATEKAAETPKRTSSRRSRK